MGPFGQRLGKVSLLVVVVLALTAPGWAAEAPARHAGIVLAVDRTAGALVLGEVGPWRGGEGASEISRRTILVTTATVFAQVRRAPGPPETRGIGGFAEMPLRPWEVEEGEFVTVEGRREGGQVTAVRVLVVVPTGR